MSSPPTPACVPVFKHLTCTAPSHWYDGQTNCFYSYGTGHRLVRCPRYVSREARQMMQVLSKEIPPCVPAAPPALMASVMSCKNECWRDTSTLVEHQHFLSCCPMGLDVLAASAPPRAIRDVLGCRRVYTPRGVKQVFLRCGGNGRVVSVPSGFPPPDFVNKHVRNRGSVCGVCREGPDDEDGPLKYWITPCGHYFCSGCLTEWGKREGSCPLCRSAKAFKRQWTHVA